MPLEEHEEELLDRYVADHLQKTPYGQFWKRDQTVTTTWAFIAWDETVFKSCSALHR